VGRDGYVDVSRDPHDQTISVGGQCAMGIRGQLLL
jgi:hypothetical protein